MKTGSRHITLGGEGHIPLPHSTALTAIRFDVRQTKVGKECSSIGSEAKPHWTSKNPKVVVVESSFQEQASEH